MPRTARTSALTSAVALVACAAALVACSDKQDVGQGLNTNFKNKVNELNTTTTAPPVTAGGVATTAPPTTKAATAATVAKTTVVTAKATTTTIDSAFKVGINGDKSGKSQLDPSSIAVRLGGQIRFVNNDSVVRSIVSTDAGFRTPDIPPGGSFVYTANKVGTFQIKDGTRPYVTGTLQVVG